MDAVDSDKRMGVWNPLGVSNPPAERLCRECMDAGAWDENGGCLDFVGCGPRDENGECLDSLSGFVGCGAETKTVGVWIRWMRGRDENGGCLGSSACAIAASNGFDDPASEAPLT